MQVLTKKLDSLEEFRQQKEQLMTKFEKLESDSKQKMADYEAKIYDLEKSHIREQDRLKVRLTTIQSINPPSSTILLRIGIVNFKKLHLISIFP